MTSDADPAAALAAHVAEARPEALTPCDRGGDEARPTRYAGLRVGR